MRRFLLIVLLVACQRDADKNKKIDLPGSAGAAPIGSANTLPKIEQIKPKLDLKTMLNFKQEAPATREASSLLTQHR